jgi:hypothetical protein
MRGGCWHRQQSRSEVRGGWSQRHPATSIAPTVGGPPTGGLATTVGVGVGGAVEAASGWLATPKPADTYPLLGVAEGVRRLQRQLAVKPRSCARSCSGDARPPTPPSGGS